MSFDDQPVLEGAGLLLRPLTAGDEVALFEAARDPAIWEGHPAKDRWQHNIFQPYFAKLLAAGGTLAITEAGPGRVIGCSRYYVAEDQACDISIGFTFIARDHWGGQTNRAVKRLMLDHAFTSFDRVWFHIDPANIRSQRATAKLGARFSHEAVIGISGAPGRWMCFVLTEADWAVQTNVS